MVKRMADCLYVVRKELISRNLTVLPFTSSDLETNSTLRCLNVLVRVPLLPLTMIVLDLTDTSTRVRN
jgi:hypothetical protein